MKVIPTWLHGVLDYLVGIGLILLPRVLNWHPLVVTLLTAFGVATLLYSLLTRYELGLVRLLPMGVHLVLDFLSGGLIIVLGLALDNISMDQRVALILIGALELFVVLLSRSDPNLERGHSRREAGA